jgi:uncharacterized protein
VSELSQRRAKEIAPEALAALALFPLPGTVLLPGTFMSFHIFEPRYRRMMDDCSDGHRVLAIAMIDEEGTPDRFGRPPIHRVAGVGLLRRSARLPDGRYNIVVEGLARVDVAEELDPDLSYRRARAHILDDIVPDDKSDLESSLASVRSLAARVVAQMGAADGEIIERLNEVEEPGTLADLIAAAAIKDALDRQKILAEQNVILRLHLAGAALAALLLKGHDGTNETATLGWGIGPGKA